MYFYEFMGAMSPAHGGANLSWILTCPARSESGTIGEYHCHPSIHRIPHHFKSGFLHFVYFFALDDDSEKIFSI